MNNKIIKTLLFSALIVAGVSFFVYGRYDDSPGAQLLGAIAAITGAWFIYSTLRSK